MPFYIRFGVGPLRFSQRVGQTRTQKRAAAKRRAQAKAQRLQASVQREQLKRNQAWARDYYSPARVAEREAQGAWRAAQEAERQARTYRAIISECHIDPLAGGSFEVTAPERDTLNLIVPAQEAMGFLSLRQGDVVQVTATPDGLGVEAFWHLARASGAKPRNAANFPQGFAARGIMRPGPGGPQGWSPRAGWGTVRDYQIVNRPNGRFDVSFSFVSDDGTVAQFVRVTDTLPQPEIGEFARGLLQGEHLTVKVSAEQMVKVERDTFRNINQMSLPDRQRMFGQFDGFDADCGWTWTPDYQLVVAAPGLLH
jgi:hypothetical protein